MTDSVIEELRRLEGLITLTHRLRAERSVRRHSEILCDALRITVRQAAV